MPTKPNWLTINNKGNDTGEIFIYGEITDEKWFEEDITPSWFKDQMAKLSDFKNINLFINSPGGGVFAGITIYNIIKRQAAKVTAYIDGLAASIASVIPMAASKIVIPKNALMMIHNPIGIAIGSSEDMRKEADLLDRVKLSIKASYGRTKQKDDVLAKMMDEETWMTGEEAVKNGFADVLDEKKDIKACFQGDKFNINGLNVNIEKFNMFPKDRILSIAETKKYERLTKAGEILNKIKMDLTRS